MSCPLLRVTLGLLEKNEAKTKDMIDILQHYQSYRPDIKGYRLLVSGDGLTCMRAKDAIAARADRVNAEKRMDNVIPESADWHEQQITLTVCTLWKMTFTLIILKHVLKRTGQLFLIQCTQRANFFFFLSCSDYNESNCLLINSPLFSHLLTS